MNFFTSTLVSGEINITTADGVSEISLAPQAGSSCRSDRINNEEEVSLFKVFLISLFFYGIVVLLFSL